MPLLKSVATPLVVLIAIIALALAGFYFTERPQVVPPTETVTTAEKEPAQATSVQKTYKVSDFIDEGTIATSTKTYTDPDGRFTFEYTDELKLPTSGSEYKNDLNFCELDAGEMCDAGQSTRVRVIIKPNPENLSLKDYAKNNLTFESGGKQHLQYDALVESTSRTGVPVLITINEDINGEAYEAGILISLPGEIISFYDNSALPLSYVQTMVHTLRIK